jgi:hypothetical protein
LSYKPDIRRCGATSCNGVAVRTISGPRPGTGHDLACLFGICLAGIVRDEDLHRSVGVKYLTSMVKL